jgi:hypothetical protein
MVFRINRLRVVGADDPGFAGLVSALPDSSDRCLCCRQPVGHPPPDSLAAVLIADESDDDPRVLCAVVCPMCVAVQSTDQLLADWAQRLIDRYGGTHVPDRRFANILAGSR